VDEAAERWNKRVFKKRGEKTDKKRANLNVHRSIERLKGYQNKLFKTTISTK